MKNTTLTVKQQALLIAIAGSEFQDSMKTVLCYAELQPVWTYAVCESFKAPKTAPGIISGAQRKGLLTLNNASEDKKEHTVELTKAGKKAYREMMKEAQKDRTAYAVAAALVTGCNILQVEDVTEWTVKTRPKNWKCGTCGTGVKEATVMLADKDTVVDPGTKTRWVCYKCRVDYGPRRVQQYKKEVTPSQTRAVNSLIGRLKSDGHEVISEPTYDFKDWDTNGGAVHARLTATCWGKSRDINIMVARRGRVIFTTNLQP